MPRHVKSDPKSFAHTMRALDADGVSPALLAIVLVAGLAGVWAGWLATARVPVYDASAAARLEVERIHPIAASVSGRVVATSLVLAREVKAGDVLLEVEADREHLETDKERAFVSSLHGEIGQIKREIAAEEEALSARRQAAQAALAEAKERLSATEAAARQAADKMRRVAQLEKQGLISASEASIAVSEARAREAELAAARAGVERLTAEQAAAERTLRAHLASLGRERVALEGRLTATVSSVKGFVREAEDRRIRAPVSGRLGEVNPVQVGAIIQAGDRLASIIPEGNLRVVAEFDPPALGRVRPGQRAQLSLDGFPWTQFGYVDATVINVASETREQHVRVELAVDRPSNGAIPLRHGMPGQVRIEVERAAPIHLLIRSLGRTVSRDPSESHSQEARSR